MHSGVSLPASKSVSYRADVIDCASDIQRQFRLNTKVMFTVTNVFSCLIPLWVSIATAAAPQAFDIDGVLTFDRE